MGVPREILHYTGYDSDRGGIVSVVRSLSKTSRFRCVLGVNQGCRQERLPPLPMLELPRMAGEQIGLMNALRARAVARVVRAWLAADPARVFHGHSRAGLLVALWLRWWGVHRFVVSVHSFGRQRWFYRAAKNMLGSRMRWLTPAMKRYYYQGGQDGWGDCVPNGVPGVPLAMRNRSDDRALRCGGAGQLTANKRWHMVLAAIAKLPAETAVEFWHVGGPTNDAASVNYARELQAAVITYGLSERVRWLGWQPSIDGLLREVDVILVPSPEESFSMVALESLYAGVPVIAARGGGPEDLVRPGENGWLVPSDDADALARQIAELTMSAAWAKLRNDSEHLSRFSSAQVASRWAEIYDQL